MLRKPSFKRKRKSLGVERQEANAIFEKKDNPMKKMEANPKIRKAREEHSKLNKRIDAKIKELKAKKPKDKLEARKINQRIQILKEIKNNTLLLRLNGIQEKRKTARKKRQENILTKQIIKIGGERILEPSTALKQQIINEYKKLKAKNPKKNIDTLTRKEAENILRTAINTYNEKIKLK